MQIRLISTLTPDDEARLADTVCAAAVPVLDLLGIAYTLRIETADGHTVERHNAPDVVTAPAAAGRR